MNTQTGTIGLITVLLPADDIGAIADINGDGLPDLLASDGAYYAGLPSGGFATAPTALQVGFTPAAMAVANLTKGVQSLIAVSASGQVAILVDAAGALGVVATATLTVGATSVIGIATADMNGDGQQDIAIATASSFYDSGTGEMASLYAVNLLLSQPGGGYAVAAPVLVGSQINQMLLADVNGDGLPDLIVATNAGIEVFNGLGSGLFGPATTYLAGSVVDSIALGDLNGDGHPDLVAGLGDVPAGSSMVDVLLNKGAGGFGTATGYLPVPATPSSSDYGSAVAVAVVSGMSGDGHADVLAITQAYDPLTGAELLDNLTLLANATGTGSLVSTASVAAQGTNLLTGQLVAGARSVAITGDTAAYDGTQYGSIAAALAQAGASPGPFSITDSAADVAANLGALQPYVTAGRLVAITLIDGGTPTISVTPGQLAADAGVLAVIQGAWLLSLTNVTAAGLAAAEANAQVTGIAVADTGAAISALIAATPAALLNAVVASITVTDGAPITLAVASLAADLTILAKLRGNVAVTLSGSLGAVANGGSLALALPYAATDPVSVALAADATFPWGLSTAGISGGTASYQPSLITAANQGSDRISWSETDSALASTIIFNGTVTLEDGPAPAFTPVAGAPQVKTAASVMLGGAVGFGNDLVRAHLLSDDAIATGSSVAVNAAGQVVYTAGSITGANAGFDTISFSLTDSVTGAAQNETATVSLATGSAAPGDFSGDGKSDLLLDDAGQTALWLMNGAVSSKGIMLPFTGPSWQMVGAGDFAASGSSDILFRAADGTVAIWMMQGSTIDGSQVLGNPGTSWMPVAIADTNGDGTSDIIWQNAEGSVAVWDMQGAVTIGAAIIADPGVNWQVRGAEALPGGGADILLQAQDGTVGLWDVNGGTLVGSTLLANPGTSWRADGLANFSGTGQPGIVLQNADGTIAIWETNGTAITSAALIGNPGVGWHVVGTGDVNGDGKADITLQNDNGAVEEWLMNGTSLISTATVSAAQAGWSVVGGGQMQFITANAAGTYAVDGAEQTFVVNAPPAGGITITGFNPAWDMIAVNGATIPNFAALQADTSNVGGAAVIALGGGATLTLPGVSPAQLLARNFSFQ